MNIEISE
jgi:hypothetical protein